MTEPEQSPGSWPWWSFVAFSVVLASEAIWYVELASFVSRDILKQGDAGSGIDYYRDFYVLPGALAFQVVVIVAAVLARHRRRHLIAVVWCAWALDVMLLAFSLWRWWRMA